MTDPVFDIHCMSVQLFHAAKLDSLPKHKSCKTAMYTTPTQIGGPRVTKSTEDSS